MKLSWVLPKLFSHLMILMVCNIYHTDLSSWDVNDSDYLYINCSQKRVIVTLHISLRTRKVVLLWMISEMCIRVAG